MSKRTRTSKIDKWINEGRGSGVGSDYKPWLRIQDVSSLGRSTRLKGFKQEDNTNSCLIWNETCKKEKLASIRDNKAIEKELNRHVEQFDLESEHLDQKASVIDIATKEKVEEETPKKSTTRLMDKLRKKRDEEYGKDK